LFALPLRIHAGAPSSVELAEADIEIGFRLVDLVESNPSKAARVVAEADEVCEDALSRLNRLKPSERESFGPLLAEVRRAIDLALPGSRTR
jgi:hypothetical protein